MGEFFKQIFDGREHSAGSLALHLNPFGDDALGGLTHGGMGGKLSLCDDVGRIEDQF